MSYNHDVTVVPTGTGQGTEASWEHNQAGDPYGMHYVGPRWWVITLAVDATVEAHVRLTVSAQTAMKADHKPAPYLVMQKFRDLGFGPVMDLSPGIVRIDCEEAS